MNRTLAKCPRCKNMVKPIRKSNRQSMWQKAFVPFAGYYGALFGRVPYAILGFQKTKATIETMKSNG